MTTFIASLQLIFHLGSNEIKILQSILHTPMNVTELSQETGLYRSQIYSGLDKLLIKGLIVRFGSKKYVVESKQISLLLKQVRHRVREAELMSQRFDQLTKSNAKDNVRTLQNKYDIMDSFMISLEECQEKTMYWCGASEHDYNMVSHDFIEYYFAPARIDKGITCLTTAGFDNIALTDAYSRSQNKNLFKYRLSEQFSVSQGGVVIIGDSVFHIQPFSGLVLQIQQQAFAHQLKTNFRITWNALI